MRDIIDKNVKICNKHRLCLCLLSAWTNNRSSKKCHCFSVEISNHICIQPILSQSNILSTYRIRDCKKMAYCWLEVSQTFSSSSIWHNSTSIQQWSVRNTDGLLVNGCGQSAWNISWHCTKSFQCSTVVKHFWFVAQRLP